MSRITGTRPSQAYVLLALALALAAVFSVLTVQPAFADDEFYVVNSLADTDDTNPGDGICATAANVCTLRAAVTESNHANHAADTKTITVPSGTYVLTDQLAIYAANIVINGAGPASEVIIDGDGITRIFDIGVAPATLTLTSLTLQGGTNINSEVVPGHWHGGAIHNHGELEMRDVIVRNNVIASDTPGAATCVTHCGAGIYNASNATLENVTFEDNRNEFNDPAADGGAIFNGGTLDVTNSTFAANTTASGSGSAIHNPGTATLLHVTVADNVTAAGGALDNDGGTLSLAASIVANNTGNGCNGTITDNGFNLSYPDATCPGLNQDPLLSPAGLTDNGGQTPTINLLSDSPAIDLVPQASCLLAEDQRGYARPQPNPGDCDAGAVEFVNTAQACLYAGSLTQVNSLDGGVQTTNSCGRGTPIVLVAGDDYYACLFAGSLSQVGTTAPANCGRGTLIGLAAGTDYYACLFAGSLSRVGTVTPLNCGRGVEIGLMGPP